MVRNCISEDDNLAPHKVKHNNERGVTRKKGIYEKKKNI